MLPCIATLTARDFFLAYFYPPGTFNGIFSKTSPNFFPALAVANIGSRTIKQVTLLDAGSRVEYPRNINRLKNMTCGMMTCETNNLEIE